MLFTLFSFYVIISEMISETTSPPVFDCARIASIINTTDKIGTGSTPSAISTEYASPQVNHSFEIVAEGYDKWKKTLYVNSPEATIELTLEDSDKSKADGSNTNNASQTDTGSGAGTGTTNNSNNAGGTGTTNNSNNTAGTGTTNTGNANNGNAGNSNSTGGNGTANDNNLRLDSISSDDLKDYLSTLSSLLDSL